MRSRRRHNAAHQAAPGNPRARRGCLALRRAALAAATSLAIGLTGCGVWPLGHRSETDAARPARQPAAPGMHALMGHDQLQRTLEPLRAHAAEQPDDPTWPWRIGTAYAAADSTAAAEAALRHALALDPTHAPALSLLSRLLFDAHRNQEAADLLEGARARGAVDRPELLAGLALHYEALGQHDRAERLIAALQAPGEQWAATGSAVTFVALHGEATDRAADCARQALTADSGSAANLNNYGITQLYAGDPIGARASFVKALELQPDLPGALYNLAIVDRFYLFDHDAAHEWFARYWALSHDDPDHLSSVFPQSDQQRPVALEGR